MAIRDLLWACPLCAAIRALRDAERRGAESCGACGAGFHRGRGSTIVVRSPDGAEIARTAAEWVDRLPDPATLADLDTGERWDERVEARFAHSESPIRGRGGEYLGRAEGFGPTITGTLGLRPGTVVFYDGHDDEGEGDAATERRRRWPLERLTAVQASSRTLQLKFRDEPVVSFRFPSGSLRFWEERLQHTLRRFYRERGRGEIAEFQPRIVTR